MTDDKKTVSLGSSASVGDSLELKKIYPTSEEAARSSLAAWKESDPESYAEAEKDYEGTSINEDYYGKIEKLINRDD